MSGQKGFRFRAFVSLLTGFSFIALAITGVILFMTPPGRVANWTNWTIWGLSKHQWGALHICLSTLFLIVSLLHIWLNFKPLMNYFISKAKAASKLRTEWILAIIVCSIVIVGSLKPFVPFSSLLDLNERIKFSWDEPKQQAPVPHAELLTITELASKANLEVDVIQLNLRNNGIEVGYDDVFGEIAEKNNMSPNELFVIATGKKTASKGNQSHGGGSGSGGGFGQKTLKAACEEMNLDVQKTIETLKAAGIEATADQTIRQIADDNSVHPSKIRQYLQ